MRKMFLDQESWQKRFQRDPLAIFLDYDGTLTSIAPTPDQARLSKAMREVLRALVKLKNVKVAIVSGRALSDLRRLVPVKGLSLVGSHGMEFCIEGVSSRRVSNKYLSFLSELNSKLELALSVFPGLLFERKPFSLAIHYRNVSPLVEKSVKRVVLIICTDAVHQRKISILTGKKVIELMPPVIMDKGQAVEKLLRSWRRKYLSIYIGDDRTDESAFAILRGGGVTIKVGVSDELSAAEYYLSSVDDVQVFLRSIIHSRNAGTA